MNDRRSQVAEIKQALVDPTRVLDALGILGEGRARRRQAAGWIVRCPVHADGTPSCSVQVRDGLLVWKCHGCQATGDVLTLIAAVRGLSTRRGFREVLLEGARMGALWHLVDQIEGRAPRADAAPRPAVTAPQGPQEPERPRAYPDGAGAFWGNLVPVGEDPDVAAYLAGRAIDAGVVEARELAMAIGPATDLPRWAVCREGTWLAAGYRLVVPMYDPEGSLRGVRAWRVTDGDGPKRLPPSGCRAAGLVMADTFGIAMLRRQREPARVVIAEGEPDYLTWATRLSDPGTAVLGIISGAWSNAFAERVPIGCRVDIRVDHDQAGDRYYHEIAATLRRRTPAIYRSTEAS